MQGGMALAPITAQELQAWQIGTCADLGPRDFQDALETSRAFVAAVSEYDGKQCDAPWSPELAPEDAARVEAAQERVWDMMMGVA